MTRWYGDGGLNDRWGLDLMVYPNGRD